MIVKNGIKFLCGVLFKCVIANYTNYLNASITSMSQVMNSGGWDVIKSGKSVTHTSSKTLDSSATASSALKCTQIFLGTDDTPVTINDHTLGNPIELDTTYATLSVSTTNNVTISQTFTNNTDEAVTIKELGLFLYVTYTTSSTTTNKRVMMAREVLSTPITIGVGESKGFSMTLDFSEINTVIS